MNVWLRGIPSFSNLVYMTFTAPSIVLLYSGKLVLQVESGRYHLYVGNACPWCHRVLLALIVRGVLPHISYTLAVDDPERASRGGWVFDTPEPVFGCKDLR